MSTVWLATVVGLLLVMFYGADPRTWRVYTCPQCGSRNGEHKEDCSWR